jgi:hypothetical protein
MIVASLWLLFSFVGMVYSAKSMAAAHRDFAATSSLAAGNSPEHIFATSVYRAQSIRTLKLALMLTAGIIAMTMAVGPPRSKIISIILVIISFLIASDAYFAEKTRRKLVDLYLEENNGNVTS